MAELRGRMLRLLREEQGSRALSKETAFETYEYVGGRAQGSDTWR
jgi:hypothetical protein